MKAKPSKRISYEEQRKKLTDFLTQFEDYDTREVHDLYGRKKYLIKLVSLSSI